MALSGRRYSPPRKSCYGPILAPTVTEPIKEVQVGEIRVEYSSTPSAAASGPSSLAKFGAINAALQGLVVTGGRVYR